MFADPPYNLQLEGALSRPDQSVVDAVDDDWDKFADFAEYDAFTRRWLAAARRVMKRDATIVVIGSYHNIFRVGAILQDLGFWILNDIVWRKANPMPNFRGRRFTNAHETMIWAARSADAKAYTFNYEALKAGNDDCQARSDWFFPICTGAERLKDVAAGARPIRPRSPRRCSPRCCFRPRTPGDLVLDPFFGSGTTGAVARRLGAGYSASSATRPTPPRRAARIAAVEPLPPEAVAPMPTKRERAARRLRQRHRGGPGPRRRDAVRRQAPPSARSCAPTAPSRSAPRSARSTRSARSRKACPPATAGPSGTSSAAAN